MLTNKTARYVKSLKLKKNREAEKKFLVEGEKCVLEVLRSDYVVDLVIVTERFLEKSYHDLPEVIEREIAKEGTLQSIGNFETNNAAIAVVREKENHPPKNVEGKVTLALDGISDPGNLGTIIRTCDWFGVDQLLLSEGSVEFYNPKVIQATMGSFTRVHAHYLDIAAFLSTAAVPKLGARIEGEDIHQIGNLKEGIVVIGSESHGISDAVAQEITRWVTIPKIGGAESLNAAIAAAVVLDNLVRK